jgi:hypothetical protein
LRQCHVVLGSVAVPAILDGVQNGSQAMNAFARLGSLDEKEKLKLRNSLLEYCKLDTLAMVKILEKLKKEVNNI